MYNILTKYNIIKSKSGKQLYSLYMNIQQCYYQRRFAQINSSTLTLVIVVDLANMTFL